MWEMLFIIDMQNDYVDDRKGKYPVPNATAIIPNIIQEIKKQEEQGEPIYYTLDQHDTEADDRSEKEKRWGMELYPTLKEALQKHTAIKKYFHSISPEDAAQLRKRYEDAPDRIIDFVGVETNVCILSNAVMLHNSFPLASIRILEDLCVGTTAELHKEALAVMKSLKMEIKALDKPQR